MRHFPFAFLRPEVERLADAQQRPFAMHRLERTFPHDDDVPPEPLPLRFMLPVAFHVAGPLRLPELHIGLRHRRARATVAMPKASPHLDERVRPGHHHVGMPRIPFVANPKPPTRRVDALPHPQLGLRVAGTDPRHHAAAVFF